MLLSILCALQSLFALAAPQEPVPVFYEQAAAQAAYFGPDTTEITPDTLAWPYVRVNNIFFLGNKKTKEKIIRRELSFKEGEVFHRDVLTEMLERDRNKVFNTNLFNTVEIKSIDISETEVEVIVEMNERWYIFPSPIFSLADRNFNDWWTNQNRDLSRVKYGLSFYQDNVRGMNERLTFTAQFGFNRIFQVSYRFPYINKAQTGGLRLFVNYLEHPNLATYTEDHILKFLQADVPLRTSLTASAAYTYRPSFYNFHTFNVAYLNRAVADTVLALNPNYFLNGESNQQYFYLSYSFNRDMRDVAQYPLRGFQVTGGVRKLGVGIFNDLDMWQAHLQYRWYKPLPKKFYFSNGIAGLYSTPREQPYSNYSALGYRQTLVRGYELYVIEGQGYLLNKTSLRYQLLKHEFRLDPYMPISQFSRIPLAIYLKAYFDQGVVHLNSPYAISDRLANRYLFGSGVGVDIISSYNSVFRLEYSFNREGESGFFLDFRSAF